MDERKHSKACEQSTKKRCKCSCEGKLHGITHSEKEETLMLAYEKELRQDYTIKSLRALEERAIKLVLVEIASELGLDAINFEKLGYGNGQIMHFIKIAIHELRASQDLLLKKVKRLQKQRDDDFQRIMDFIKGE